MLIHVPTVCFILGALAFLFAVKMAADGLGRGESTKVLACWCFAFIFLAAASALMAVRPFGPSGARSVLPSFLLVVGFGLIWRGIAEFTGRRAPWILIAIGPLSFLVAWSQGIFSQDGHRLIFMSIVVSSYLIVSGRALFHGGGGLRSARLAGCV